MNATDVKVSDIESVADRHPGVRGLAQLRRTLELVDGGAESPYESLTRLLFVRVGFPPPETQIPVCDEYDVLIAVIDMGWRDYLVGVDVDVDGAQSLDQSASAALGRRSGVLRTKSHGRRTRSPEESQAQLAWPSRTSADAIDPSISSTVMPTNRWSRHPPSTSRYRRSSPSSRKPDLGQHGAAGRVLRAHRRLQPMQPHRTEGVVHTSASAAVATPPPVAELATQ